MINSFSSITDQAPLPINLFKDLCINESNEMDARHNQRADWNNSGCNIKEILTNMTIEQSEHHFSSFCSTYLKYRKVVAEWMIDVCEYFTLDMTTTHAAIAYLDRLQPNEKITRFEWQMLAIACIAIASKYNESEDDVPDLATLEEITQQRITNETLLNYELYALRKMHWKLNARTPMHFLATAMVGGLVAPSESSFLNNQDNMSLNDKYITAENVVHHHAKRIAHNVILDAEMKGYVANHMACAIAYVARYKHQVSPVWNNNLTETLGDPSQSNVQEIINALFKRTDLVDEFRTASSLSVPNKPQEKNLEKNKSASPVGVDDLEDSPSTYKENIHPNVNNVDPNQERHNDLDYYN
jgi:hypothetical protein